MPPTDHRNRPVGNPKTAHGGHVPTQWHPSMGAPQTATGGAGAKPPSTPKVATGDGSQYDNVYDMTKHPRFQGRELNDPES
jgi:hypothetical protein